MATPEGSLRSGPDLWERLADFDPGGLRLVRGLHLALAIALAAAAGYLLVTRGAALLDGLIGPWVRAELPAFAGVFSDPKRVLVVPMITAVVAAHLILLVQPSYRSRELKQTFQLAGLAIAYLTVLGLAAPGAWGYGALPMHLWWIAIIAFGLYLRRYGMNAAFFGVALILLTLFAVLINPDHGIGLWLPVAAITGAVIGFLVRFLTWRPSAVAVYRAQQVRYLEAVASDLTLVAGLIRQGKRLPQRDRPLRRRWIALSNAMEFAVAEAPDEADAFAQEVAGGYRLLLACEVAVEALGEVEDAELVGHFTKDRLADGLEQLSARITSVAEGRDTGSQGFRNQLLAAREELLADTALNRRTKLQLVRLMTGVVRIEASLDTFGGRIEKVPMPPAPTMPAQAAAMGRRLALQGLVAASITTGLNYAFHFEHAYWATLTVALVLNGTVGQTLAKTLRRAIGTAVGVLAAIALMPFISHLLWLELTLIFVSLIVAIMVFDVRYEIASALIGFTVVVGLHMLEGAGTAVMLARAYETFIGAGVALAVAWTVVPAFSSDEIGSKVKAFIAHCRMTFAAILANPSPQVDHTAPLAGEVRGLLAELPSLEAERWFGRAGGTALNQIKVLMEALVTYLGLYERSAAATAGADLGEGAVSVLKELDDRIDAAFDAVFAATPADSDFQDLLTRFGAVAPLDGSVPAAQAFSLVERYYYGRKLADTLAEFRTIWARSG